MDKINEIWPAWHMVEMIGRGAYGEVYKAKRELQGETFYSAVKVIKIPGSEQDVRDMAEEGHTSQSIRYYYESIAKDLMNEIKVLDCLKSAGNVVHIEDFDVREQADFIGWKIYIRMELLENLDAYRSRHTMTVRDVVQLGIDLCTALEYCEKSSIVHRDIKPKNIFVDRYGTYKLGDFGIARQMERTQSTMSLKGTELYMAPEVRFGMSGSSFNVDIYSLGLVMYRLLNKNRMPFEPVEQEMLTYRDREQAIERRLKGEQLPKPVDADDVLSNLIRRACEYDKEQRYPNASEMRRDLMKYLREEALETQESPLQEENVQQKESEIHDEEETVHIFSQKMNRQDGFYHYSFRKTDRKKEPQQKEIKEKKGDLCYSSWLKAEDVIKPLYLFQIEAAIGLTRETKDLGKHLQVCIPKGTEEGQYLRLGIETPLGGKFYYMIQFDPGKAGEGLLGEEARVLWNLNRNPDDLNSWMELGRMRRRRNLLQDARKCFLKALETQGEHVKIFVELGDMSIEKEDYKEALQWYKIAYERTRTNTINLSASEYGTLYRRYAISAGKCGDVNLAQMILDEAVAKKFLRKKDAENIGEQLGLEKRSRGFFSRWKK